MTTRGTKGAYRSDDRELLMGLYQRLFVSWLLPLVPAAVPPNAITVVGQTCIMLAVAATWGATHGSLWLYLVSPILMIAYVVADNIDGQHARRTGRASPTGEFLDHGLDGLASGCMLLIGVLVLHLDAFSATLLVSVGAFAYFLCYWEQYRTGVLVIPALSATEAITILSVVQVLAFIFREPSWLFLRADEFTASSAVLYFAIFGYLAALIPPLARAAKARARLTETLPVLAMMAGMPLYVVNGGSPLAVGAMGALLAAEISCRLILLRRGLWQGSFFKASHGLILLPLVPAAFLPDLWTPVGWASLAVVIALALFSRTLIAGLASFARAEEWADPEISGHT